MKPNFAPSYYLHLGPPKPFTPEMCSSCGGVRDTPKRLCAECETLRDSYAFTKSMRKRRK